MKLPQPGEVFGERYTIVERLGEGGFAIVYHATDSADRKVALKVLKPERDGYSREVRSRFDREVRVLAQLRDPHTVRLFDHGCDDHNNLLFMVFEFIPGQDLSEVLADVDRLDAALAIRILRQLSHSLREAHMHGLLHRDLKPANIRVFEYAGDPWRVKLLDFGIARAMLAGESNITKTGELIGTPRYMSPEQLMGAALGPTSDIYSLGLVGLEMLMGAHALQGNSWGAQIDRLQTGHVFSIPEMERAGIGLITVIQRMCARKPEDRYRSMDDVLAAFDALERGEPIPSTRPAPRPVPPSTGGQPVDPAAASQSMELLRAQRETNRLKVIAMVVVGLTLLASLIAYDRLQRDEPVQPRAIQVARPSLVGTPGEGDRPAPIPDTADVARDIAPAIDLGVDGPTPGCGHGAELAGRITDLDDEELRGRSLFVPSDYDPAKPYPLVVAFHEDWQTPAAFFDQTLIHESADERGYVVVAPLGATDEFPWRLRHHVKHIKPMVDDVAARLCIDPDRIFLFGHGSGGTAVQFLSCDRWAAAAVTSSYRPGLAEAKADMCHAPPIRHLQFHAMDSQRMPAHGGGTAPCTPDPKYSVAELEQHWLTRNRCSKHGRLYRTEPTGTCTAYKCEAELISCRLDGGHGFPGGTNESPLNLLCDPAVADFPARELIFKFFDSHPED